MQIDDRLRSLILGSVLGLDPTARAQAEQLAERERFTLQAQALGLTPGVVAQMRELAERVGPMTTLPNSAVWRAVWESMLNYAKRGEPPLPTDSVLWARDIWGIMFAGDPPIVIPLSEGFGLTTGDPQHIHAFSSLIDALRRARA